MSRFYMCKKDARIYFINKQKLSSWRNDLHAISLGAFITKDFYTWKMFVQNV